MSDNEAIFRLLTEELLAIPNPQKQWAISDVCTAMEEAIEAFKTTESNVDHTEMK